MVAQGYTVDLKKPLVFQVGHLGEDYQEWVHQPIPGKEGPRFFESDFWEFLTRTVWWAIPTIWLPVVCCFLWRSVAMGHTASEMVAMVLFGVLVWTLLEYTLHRFLFHIKTKSYWANTAHYLIHGCHHKHPMDGLRLVFPPAATAVLCIPLFNVIRALSTPSTAPALFGGGLLGYVLYDCTHYYLHHGQPSKGPARGLKVKVNPLACGFPGSISDPSPDNPLGIRFAEVPSEPPLQDPEQGLRDHFLSLGQDLRDSPPG